MSTRVYVASTLRRLREVLDAGGIGPAPFTAHAVTDAVRSELGDAGDEEWEYAAATAAAQATLALLRPDEPARRVVLALDVPDTGVSRRAGDAGDAGDPASVQVDDEAPLRWVAAVLADSADAASDVAAARDAVAAGSPAADRLLERCLDHELGWWAAQEIDRLLEETADD